SWDLRRAAPNPINLRRPSFVPPWAGESKGPLAAPGEYSVSLFIESNGKMEAQGNPQTFIVKAVPTTVSGTDFQAVAAFQQQTSDMIREISSAGQKLNEVNERFKHIDKALIQTASAEETHFASLSELKKKWADLRLRLSGDPAKRELNEPDTPSISARAGQIAYGHWDTRQMPTQTFKDNLDIAKREFGVFSEDLDSFMAEVEDFEAALEKAGAPYTKGRKF
ncbi:MAG: glycosyl hydrolase, partial [Bacteroidota bacterium]